MEFERYVIALKRGDVCCECGSDLPSGFRVAWEPYNRTVTCLDCAGPDVIINLHQGSVSALVARPHKGQRTG